MIDKKDIKINSRMMIGNNLEVGKLFSRELKWTSSSK